MWMGRVVRPAVLVVALAVAVVGCGGKKKVPKGPVTANPGRTVHINTLAARLNWMQRRALGPTGFVPDPHGRYLAVNLTITNTTGSRQIINTNEFGQFLIYGRTNQDTYRPDDNQSDYDPNSLRKLQLRTSDLATGPGESLTGNVDFKLTPSQANDVFRYGQLEVAEFDVHADSPDDKGAYAQLNLLRTALR